MEVKIGIHSVPRELIVETETPQEDIERELTAALGSGSLFTLDVVKGGRVLVPADKIAYLEFIGPESRRVGFGNITLSFCLRRTFPHISGSDGACSMILDRCVRIAAYNDPRSFSGGGRRPV